MDEKPSPPSLQDLDARLQRLRAETGGNGPGSGREGGQGGLGMAFTIASHLVAGLGVGAGIGYLLDRSLGTSPGLLITFFLLGAAAGGMNVYRTARGYGMALGYRPTAPEAGDTVGGTAREDRP
jgi:ATP synthase protein I